MNVYSDIKRVSVKAYVDAAALAAPADKNSSWCTMHFFFCVKNVSQ